jgi:hypothetical protein
LSLPRNEVVKTALGCGHSYTYSVEYPKADIAVISEVNKNNVIASGENFTIV